MVSNCGIGVIYIKDIHLTTSYSYMDSEPYRYQPIEMCYNYILVILITLIMLQNNANNSQQSNSI